jgi:hypothetical protein
LAALAVEVLELAAAGTCLAGIHELGDADASEEADSNQQYGKEDLRQAAHLEPLLGHERLRRLGLAPTLSGGFLAGGLQDRCRLSGVGLLRVGLLGLRLVRGAGLRC